MKTSWISELHWYPAVRSSIDASETQEQAQVPLVIILPWMFAAQNAIDKHIQLVHAAGCDAAVYTSNPASPWFSMWQCHQARQLGSQLEKHLTTTGERPVIFAVYSGSNLTVFGRLLTMISMHLHHGKEDSFQQFQLSHSSQPTQPSRVADKLGRHAIGATKHQHSSFRSSSNGDASEPAAEPNRHAKETAVELFIEWVLQPKHAPQPVVPTPQQLDSMLASPTHPCRLLGTKQDNEECLYPTLANCLCGVWFDSSPVDFTSVGGRRMLHHSWVGQRWLGRHLINTGAVALDMVMLDHFEWQRAQHWVRLAASPFLATLPTLFCYSWDDEQSDASRIHGLARFLKWKGGQITEMAWQHSQHVAHLKEHPQDYTAAVHDLLRNAVAIYNKTHAAQVNLRAPTTGPPKVLLKSRM